jgi:hypothetical protein
VRATGPPWGKGRRRVSAQECVVFLHIPKTAGSTLSTALVMSYPQRRTIRLDLINRPAADIETAVASEKLRDARLIRGHLPYGIHRYVPRPCRYVTVLREPVARAISDYRFIIRNPSSFRDHPLHDLASGGGMSLEDYLESEGLGRKGNRQTRMLSGRYEGPLAPGDLEEAKHNLESFLVVGLTERFEETFAMMRRALRLRVPFYATKLVAPPIDLSDRAIELIRQYNELDTDLYRFGRKLFADQVASQGRSFGVEAAAFRAARPISRALGDGRLHRLFVRRLHRRGEGVRPTRP